MDGLIVKTGANPIVLNNLIHHNRGEDSCVVVTRLMRRCRKRSLCLRGRVRRRGEEERRGGGEEGRRTNGSRGEERVAEEGDEVGMEVSGEGTGERGGEGASERRGGGRRKGKMWLMLMRRQGVLEANDIYENESSGLQLPLHPPLPLPSSPCSASSSLLLPPPPLLPPLPLPLPSPPPPLHGFYFLSLFDSCAVSPLPVLVSLVRRSCHPIFGQRNSEKEQNSQRQEERNLRLHE
eukprot:759825-Hanusia_phi.AAC.17